VWQHLAPITPSLTAGRQSIAASIQKLPDSVVESFSQLAMDSRCVRRNDQFEVCCWFFTRNIYKI